jgi:hypothetical protein
MAIIEFQVSTAAFLSSQLTNLQSQKFCSPAPFSIAGYQIVVDHISIGANSIRNSVVVTEYIFFEQPVYGTESQAVSALQTQVAQEITVFLADQNDILAHPNQPPTLILPIPATIVVNLRYFQSANNDCYFNVSFDHLELGQLPPLPPGVDAQTIQQQAQTLAQGLVPSQTIPFNLAQMVLSKSGGSGNVENAGMSVDSTLSRIAFRAEVGSGTPFDPDAWQSFFNGNVPDRLQGADWALFLDHDIIEDIVAAPVQKGVEQHPSSDFELVTGFGSFYSNPAPNRAHVQVTFSGNVSAGPCTVWTDIFIDTDITVGAPNSLTVDMNISWNTETTLCTVTIGILGAAIGLITDLVLPFLSAVINPITGFLGAVAAALYIENTQGPPRQSLPNCNQLSDTHYLCTQSMPLNQTTQFGTLGFNSLAALQDGVALLGQLQPAALATATIKPSFSNFTVGGPIISCGEISGHEVNDFLKDPPKYVRFDAGVSLDNGGTAPLYLCSASVVNDPLGIFPQSALSVVSQQAPIELQIEIPYPTEQYFNAPYPCQILVSTNGGIRLVSIPAPTPLTQQEITAVANGIATQVGLCNELVDGWFRLFHQFNPIWSVDPPPGETVEHYWDFEIIGLAPGETATLVGTQEETLVTATAQTGEAVHLNAVVAPVAAGGEIKLIHGAGPSGAAPGAHTSSAATASAPHGIATTQQLIIELADIPLTRPALRIGTAYLEGAQSIFVTFTEGLSAYDLSRPTKPRLVNSWQVPGLGGAISRRGELLAFGDDGFVILSSQRPRRALADCCAVRPICDAVKGQGVIYALGSEDLEIYSNSLRLLGSVPLEGAERLARVGGRLVAGGSRGISFFDLQDPVYPKITSYHLDLAVDDLAVPADSGGLTLLAVSAKGPAWLLDFSNSSQPRIVAHYPLPPWFLYTARLPGLLVSLDHDRTSIVVGAFGASKKG